MSELIQRKLVTFNLYNLVVHRVDEQYVTVIVAITATTYCIVQKFNGD